MRLGRVLKMHFPTCGDSIISMAKLVLHLLSRHRIIPAAELIGGGNAGCIRTGTNWNWHLGKSTGGKESYETDATEPCQ